MAQMTTNVARKAKIWSKAQMKVLETVRAMICYEAGLVRLPSERTLLVDRVHVGGEAVQNPSGRRRVKEARGRAYHRMLQQVAK